MGWVGLAAAAVSAVGSKMASDKAAKAQTSAADSAAQVQREQYERIQENLAPYREFGAAQLPALQESIAPIDRFAELSKYYQSPEYQMLSSQGRNQQLAASEATGGLGSTYTGNALAAIAPQLGMQYLGQREAQQADLFNRLMSSAGMGLNASAMTGQAGQQYATQAGQAFTQAGQAQAGRSLAQGQLIGNIAGAVGGYYGGQAQQPQQQYSFGQSDFARGVW